MALPYAAQRGVVLACLADGQPREAFLALEGALVHSGLSALSASERADALNLLAVVIGRIHGGPFVERARAAAKAPEDAQVLRALALELARTDAARVADVLLARAHVLAPGDLAIVMDWTAVLELLRENARARELLRGAPQGSFVVGYHAAFHAIMCGDLAAAEASLISLGSLPDARPELVEALRGMLVRAEHVARVSPLDEHDLRGWQAVLDGSLVLHRAPERPAEMSGRYAVMEETPRLASEAIARLLAVLEATGARPARVYALPGARSQALARALAHRASVAVEAWSPSSAAPGVVVADDLDEVPLPLAQALSTTRAGQILWAHAACWTRPYPFAADVVSHQYERRLQADDIAEPSAILDARVRPEELADVAQLVSLALALREVPPAYAAGMFARPHQPRLKQRRGSPVRSV